MFGLLALMAVMLGMVSFVCYWISWELQDRRTRESFANRASKDLMKLFAVPRNALQGNGLGIRRAQRHGKGRRHSPVGSA